MKKAALFVMAALLLPLLGCKSESGAPEPRLCRVVLEEGEGFTCDGYARTVERGGTVTST